jgi:2-succinyl-5-enolpyruvyl-6-hydroxy-3-cyclohexene-1-carboxylate synthase
LQPFDSNLSTALAALQEDRSAAVIADLTGNLHQSGTQVHHWDMILSTKSAEVQSNLAPDLLITFGGPVVSKALKLFLRRHRPQEHWHIDPAARAIDTFQCLTRIIPTDGRYFFENLARRSATQASATYLDLWLNLEAAAQAKLIAFFETAPFGEFAAMRQVLLALPEPSRLQLGNSMPVRYAEYLGLARRAIQVNANRGTSGIDGTLSTTVGAALATDQITTLICGDLAFFYDRNGLWHNDLPKNLRIVVLNNHGGGIFHLIDGPTQLPAEELRRFFETPQPLTARRTAADHNCAYFHCATGPDLQAQLPAFFAPETGPAILEIETDGSLNTQVFQQFKAMMA